MRTRIVIAMFCLTLAAPLHALGQDLSHLYQPYSFKLPFLEAGEYILALDYYSARWDIDETGADTLYATVQQGVHILRASGTVALHNRLLAQLAVELTPENTEFSEETVGGDFHSRRVNTNVSPVVLLVYRPLRGLEVSGSMQYRKETVGIEASYASPFDTQNADEYRIEAGVRWFGRF